MDARLKAKYKYHHGRNTAVTVEAPVEDKANKAAKIATASSREARSNQRRLLTAFGTYYKTIRQRNRWSNDLHLGAGEEVPGSILLGPIWETNFTCSSSSLGVLDSARSELLLW